MEDQESIAKELRYLRSLLSDGRAVKATIDRERLRDRIRELERAFKAAAPLEDY